MTETYSNSRNGLNGGMSSTKNRLMSKVVLLVGNDAEILHSLAAEFAAHGGDVALASSQLSAEAADTIRESVQAFGGRFYLVDKGLLHKGLSSNGQKSETIINSIKRELGRMDIVIDMSAHKSNESQNETNLDSPQPQWWLSKAVLQEINN